MEWIVSEQFLALSDSPLWAGLPLSRAVKLLQKYVIRNYWNTKYVTSELGIIRNHNYVRAQRKVVVGIFRPIITYFGET